MRKESTYQWNMRLRYKQTSGGKLLGQCLDFPFITVKGSTPDELIQRIYRDIRVYFHTFPDKAEKFLSEHGKLVDEKVVAIQTPTQLPPAKKDWQDEELVCTV